MHFYCHFENNELTPWTHITLNITLNITLIKLNKESPVVELGSVVPEKKALQENSNLIRKMYGGESFWRCKPHTVSKSWPSLEAKIKIKIEININK